MNRELLQAPLAPLTARNRTMAFDSGDASGWDECLPSVAACKVDTAAGIVEIPDHGDVWRVAWEEASYNGQRPAAEAVSARFRAECFSLPLALERHMTLTEKQGGWHLDLHYTIRNLSKVATPWSWSAHPLFAVEAGDTIRLPASIAALRLEGSGDGRLGSAGQNIAWPVASLLRGGRTDLSVVQSPTSRVGDKLFAGPLVASEDWCEVRRPSVGVSIRFGIDPKSTPYLGLWLCYGGWPNRPGPKQMCVAVEPSTAPVDSLAQTGSWSRVLGPGESYSWPMRVDIEII
jgi:galactose mutarotase-like enzyme